MKEQINSNLQSFNFFFRKSMLLTGQNDKSHATFHDHRITESWWTALTIVLKHNYLWPETLVHVVVHRSRHDDMLWNKNYKLTQYLWWHRAEQLYRSKHQRKLEPETKQSSQNRIINVHCKQPVLTKQIPPTTCHCYFPMYSEVSVFCHTISHLMCQQ